MKAGNEKSAGHAERAGQERRKTRLKVSEFARLCRTTRDTLLHYDRRGLLKPRHVGENGYRYYGVEQYWEFDRISLLKESGLDLARIGDMVRAKDTDGSLPVFERCLQALEEERERLDHRLAMLRELVDLAREVEHSPFDTVFFEECGERRFLVQRLEEDLAERVARETRRKKTRRMRECPASTDGRAAAVPCETDETAYPSELIEPGGIDDIVSGGDGGAGRDGTASRSPFGSDPGLVHACIVSCYSLSLLESMRRGNTVDPPLGTIVPERQVRAGVMSLAGFFFVPPRAKSASPGEEAAGPSLSVVSWPAGRYANLCHRGSFEGHARAFADFTDHLSRQGLEPVGDLLAFDQMSYALTGGRTDFVARYTVRVEERSRG